MFLRLNGIEINSSDSELAAVFEDLAAGKMSEADLAQWFAENTMPPEW
jgi:prophage maintenance system killer protein